jgi:molybdopterin molybdotransferase
VLKQGIELRPAHIALAAQLGLQTLSVFDAPRVALLATGSEILSVVQDHHADPHPTLSQREKAFLRPLLPLGEGRGEGLDMGKIYDANTPMLQAAVRDAGAKVILMHHIEDTLESTIHELSEAMQIADIICTTGGVSVGEHDFVKQAAQTLGFETIFWRVRQKPGKPLFFAKRGNTLLFGLPGNPVSTLMCFLQYVQPVIASMLGRKHLWKTLEARMSTALMNTGGRAEFVRVQLDFSQKNQPPTAIPLAKQESFMLTSLTEADGFVFLDIDAEIYNDAMVEVMLF